MLKQIKEHPDYCVSDDGEVYAITERQGLKALKKDISNGYARVQLNRRNYYVADLVAKYFLQPRPNPNYKLFYVDGNRSNCAKGNLRWMSKSDIQRYSQYTVEYRQQFLGEW